MPQPKPESPEQLPGEHIFAATPLTKLALRWKELTEQGRLDEATVILEEIIKGSTNMFERLAQHENFHYTVDLPTLVAAAQEKVSKWLMYWRPHKGRLFSWFSKCAKNAFRSEIVKQNQFRNRIHSTGDNLEKFFGAEDHGVDKKDVAAEVAAELRDIHVRWYSPQERGALRYLIACITADEHDRQTAIKSVTYAWGISHDLAKFFYQFALIQLRDKMYARAHIGFTEQDLFRHRYSYTHLVQLLDYIEWDVLKQIIAVMGGTRIKFPTLQHLVRLKEDYNLYKEIDDGDKDPDSVATTGKKHKRSPRNAQEVYLEMVETINPNRSGEYHLYDDD